MDPKLRMLVWQEFRQRRTQLAICLLWIVGSTFADGWSQGVPPADNNHFGTALFYAILAPIFLAMRTSLGEITDRTRSFSDSLPISPRWRAAIRLAGGAATLVVPIVVATALLSVAFALGWFGTVKIPPMVVDNSAWLLDREHLFALSVLGQLWYAACVTAFSAVYLYLLLSLLGTTLRAESHLGYWGAVLAMPWFVGYALGHAVEWRDYPATASLIGVIAPQATLASFNYVYQNAAAVPLLIFRAVFFPLCASALIQLGLAAIFVRRYSHQLAVRTAGRAEKTARRAWSKPWMSWKPWLPSRGAALAWLAWRQAVPLCLPGLALACLLNLFSIDMQEVRRNAAMETALANQFEAARAYPSGAEQLAEGELGDVIMIEERLEVDYPGDSSEVPAEASRKLEAADRPIVAPYRFKHVWQSYKDSMSSVMWFIGSLWAVVVGAGLFSSEIDWRFGEFWRTRPISAGQLFGVKFVAGLLAVLLVLDGTVIAAGWKSPHWGEYHAMNWAYFACIVPLHATLFALAVAWTCVLRRAVLGGVAAQLTYVAIGRALDGFEATRPLDPIAVYGSFGFVNRTAGAGPEHYPAVAAGMALILIASILIGWLALRRYDPRRQTD